MKNAQMWSMRLLTLSLAMANVDWALGKGAVRTDIPTLRHVYSLASVAASCHFHAISRNGRMLATLPF